MVHAPQYMQGVGHQLVTALPLDVRNKSHATTVVLVGGIVEAVFRR